MRARAQGQQGQPMLKEDLEGSIDKDEWTMFLQGNIMASMMTEEVKEKHDGNYLCVCLLSSPIKIFTLNQNLICELHEMDLNEL